MQSKIRGRKNASYYSFLKAIGEENLSAFDERQEAFVKYVSEMLPIVRPYEYLIIQKIVEGAGKAALKEIKHFTEISIENFTEPAFSHAIKHMLKSGFFTRREEENASAMYLDNVVLNTEMDEFVRDLLEFGLGKYDAEFVELAEDESKTFHLWSKYRKEQVQQLLLNNPKDIMKGTRTEDDIVYAYVTVVKNDGTKEGFPDGDEGTYDLGNVTRGESGSLCWENGIWKNPSRGATGRFSIRFYDGDGNKIGESSVNIT